MKHVWKVLLLALLVLTMVLGAVACGNKDETPGNTDPGNGGPSNPPGTEEPGSTPEPPTLGVIDLTWVKLGGTSKLITRNYDGNNFIITESNEHRYLKGNPTPEKVLHRFEYWNADNTALVADGETGVKDVGTYTIRAIYYDPNKQYSDNYVTATLIISQTESVIYHMPEGAVKDDTNPESYSLSDLAKEEAGIILGSANLADYAFKGWYTSEDHSGAAISALTLEAFPNGGEIHLWAWFQAYRAYPQPYEYTTNVTTAPTSLPAVPGLEDVQKDAVCLLDMSLYADGSATSMTQQGFRFGNPTSDLGGQNKKKPSVPAGKNGYGLEWTEYHPTQDGQYHSIMQFTAPTSTGYHLKDYNVLEFWVYSANATDQVFTVFIITGSENNRSMTFDVKLNYSGWKKFSVFLCGATNDMYAPAGVLDTITEFRFLGQPNAGLRAQHANLATEEMQDVTNFIFFSNFYLTSYDNDFAKSTIGNVNNLTATLSNLTDLTVSATKTDSEIAALLSKVDLGTTGTTIREGASNVFTDLSALTNAAGYKAVYERLFWMAQAWNDASSTYYRSDALIDAIVAGMNYMAAGSHSMVANLPALTDDMADCCLYIADIMNIFGDNLSEIHAQSWGALALAYYPSALGYSTDAFNSAYIYTSVNLGLRNMRETIFGLAQLSHLFTSGELLVTTDNARLTRYTALIAALDNSLATTAISAKFYQGLYQWFYDCVDAFTVDGKLPSVLGDYDLVPALRAMFLLYPKADAATQNTFASYVKMYLAKDATLKSRLTAAQYYDLEGEVLAAIEQNSVAAAAPSVTACKVFEKIGCAIYKTETSYLYISPDGVISSGINASGITASAANDTFYGLVVDDMMCILRGTQTIMVSADSVEVKAAGNAVFGNDSYKAAIINGSVVGDTLLDEVSAPVILFAVKNDDGSITFTVYNYTHASDSMALYIKEIYRMNPTLAVTVEPDTEDGFTTITMRPADQTGYVFSFTVTPD